ncbi:SDR family mycofactocin-dependent oxidoreductase [Amycolatopsis sulphurea]|uniref:SDR family mycofactocin-dependent oxidoreductase n=1 Tax=Amycolatopsis sulphurea TaxID=76022 RepID=A0A2A9FEY2_9PSEU|nr:mycofactocin-coupled SDR family oxidoreductase [Amycolatopsis sulphurea]PFG49934.1 SDR family mycofactocin-dependent oxidoreductase [Amycolatopsis sulphurea]
MGKLEGKVAFITGAARGQGRSHAVRLAREGADIIALDWLTDLGTVDYPMARQSDMDETVRLVQATGRRIHPEQADVRDFPALSAAYRAGVAALGPVDIVLGNAAVCMLGTKEVDPVQSFNDMIGVNLVGVWNTVYVAAQDMVDRGAGGAIVLTSSTQGLSGRGGDANGGVHGYAAAKHGVVGLMRSFANWLSPHGIRVNTVHPTGVATPMVENEVIGRYLEENPQAASMAANLMPVGLVEPVDISNAILYLVSDDGRYVTGVTLPVDAGFTVK